MFTNWKTMRPERQMILLVYSYDVAGVTYEASQDVTHLRQFIDLYSCRLGLPASVRYDPHNPGRFYRNIRNMVWIAETSDSPETAAAVRKSPALLCNLSQLV